MNRHKKCKCGNLAAMTIRTDGETFPVCLQCAAKHDKRGTVVVVGGNDTVVGEVY